MAIVRVSVDSIMLCAINGRVKLRNDRNTELKLSISIVQSHPLAICFYVGNSYDVGYIPVMEVQIPFIVTIVLTH